MILRCPTIHSGVKRDYCRHGTEAAGNNHQHAEDHLRYEIWTPTNDINIMLIVSQCFQLAGFYGEHSQHPSFECPLAEMRTVICATGPECQSRYLLFVGVSESFGSSDIVSLYEDMKSRLKSILKML